MRLEKIENNTEIDNQIRILDYIDCGEFYLLTEWDNANKRMVTLTQNTVLEDLQKKHGGDIYYHKLCKTTFRLYGSEGGEFYSDNIDEAMNGTEIYAYEGFIVCRILKAFVNGEGLEKLNSVDRLVRWPNEKGGRGEHWYWLLRS
jgi:hypothetical protein